MCFTIISYSNSYEELKSSLLYIVRLSIHTQLLMLETQYLCLCWVKNVFYLTSIQSWYYTDGWIRTYAQNKSNTESK